jgi:hypothetical protein
MTPSRAVNCGAVIHLTDPGERSLKGAKELNDL